ncbi:MAG: glucose-6-phosphate isomerase, partial [Chloroflexota bacterium]
ALLGLEAAGAHFVAITDPDSTLVPLAERYGFRVIFRNDPNIGGRYSALSFFGLVPAALVGVDLALLLDRALEMARLTGPAVPTAANPAARLGLALATLANAGRDKLTLLAPPELASVGDWVEQLIAESLGKQGRGVVPVVGEPLGEPDTYGHDRLFVHLRLQGQTELDEPVAALRAQGHPVITLALRDRYDLGGQFLLWELATAVAGHGLGVHPFDQPNVEAAKVRASQLVEAYRVSGALPPAERAPWTRAALEAFFAQAQPGDYVAVQAYVAPSAAADELLTRLRLLLRRRLGLATTVGYGPRFLHSTGQLHKGDRGNGLFVQLVSAPEDSLPIPDAAGALASSLGFGVLKLAQAAGDGQALRAAERRLIRLDLGPDAVAGLRRLLALLED